MTPEERARLDELLAGMFTPPTMTEMGGSFFLLYSQKTDAGPRVMMWRPETPQEVADARRFYEAAHGIGAFARPVPRGKARRRPEQELALIRGILEHRDDLTRYLVYADYLTEHGDTQGDFIRLSVQISQADPDSPDAAEMNRRWSELLAAHGKEWLRPLAELGLEPRIMGHYDPLIYLSHERGVVEEVTIDRRGILPGQAARLFAAAPLLRKVLFEQNHLDPAGLARVRQLTQIEELDLTRTNLNPIGLAALLRSKYLTGLRTLDLSSNNFEDAGAEVLAGAKSLAGRLRSLSLRSCGLTPAGFAALAASPVCSGLKALRVGGNGLTADSLRPLARSPQLGGLEELELGHVRLDADAVGHLRGAVFAGTLTSLDLDAATFPPGALAEFVLSNFPALRSLNLSSVELRSAGGQLLGRVRFARQLETLRLDLARLGDRGVAALAHGRFTALRELDLSRNRIGNTGAAALAAAGGFPRLKSLKLWSNRIGRDGAAALAASPILAPIEELNLADNKIGPAGAKALAESPHLALLRQLTVTEKDVGPKGKKALLDHFGDRLLCY